MIVEEEHVYLVLDKTYDVLFKVTLNIDKLKNTAPKNTAIKYPTKLFMISPFLKSKFHHYGYILENFPKYIKPYPL